MPSFGEMMKRSMKKPGFGAKKPPVPAAEEPEDEEEIEEEVDEEEADADAAPVAPAKKPGLAAAVKATKRAEALKRWAKE